MDVIKQLEEQRLKSAVYLQKKLDKYIGETSLLFYAWPQGCGSTNPFGVGGDMMTTFTVTCWVDGRSNSCILWLCGRPQYHEKFEIGMRYKI